ncbi:MAG: hypothetical protein AABZ77_08360 [Chloroflexota bacterium]|mgnify:FL=1
MTFLKNLTVSLFSFLLFLSLTVFGIAFAVKSTALNPDFVASELSRLEIAATVKELVQIEPPPEIPKLNEIIYQTVAGIEPQFKEQSGFAIHSVYAYLLGESQTPDLKSILRKTYLSTDFVTPLVNSLNVSSLAGPFLTQKFAEAIPVKIANLDKYVTDALTGTEPSLKQQVIAVSGTVFDYLLGESPTLTASISLEPVKANLTRVLLNSPLPELAAIPQSMRQEFSVLIPSTYPLDESVIGNKVPANIASGIASAEDSLGQMRKYVAMFQQYYPLLLVFIALLALGIILIVRNVKDITHRLGIPLLTYGAMEYAGVWVTKYLISSGKMQVPEIPPQLETWLLQLINNSLKPLEIFSLTLLIIGGVLTVISFLYKRKQDLTWS